MTMLHLYTALASQCIKLPYLWCFCFCETDGRQEGVDPGGPIAEEVLRILLALGWTLDATLELIFEERDCTLTEASIVARALHVPLRWLVDPPVEDDIDFTDLTQE